MPQYLITWEIELDADSPEEAAEEALRIHRDPDSEATVFDVMQQSTGETVCIDVALEGTKRRP